jgi:hypothetical protein
LLAYLNGKTAASASIYRSAPLESCTQVKRTADDTLRSVAKKPRLEETQLRKVKEQLSAGLDVPKEASVTVDNIRWVKQEIEGVGVKLYASYRLSEKACYSNHHCLAGQWLC